MATLTAICVFVLVLWLLGITLYFGTALVLYLPMKIENHYKDKFDKQSQDKG